MDEELLAQFSAGVLDAASMERVIAHLDRCGSCRRAVAAGLAYEETLPSGGSNVDVSGRSQIIGGRFEVIAFLKAGGMGAVYRGHDHATGADVAIKILKPNLLAEQPGLVARFAREGALLRRLQHPNIINFVDAVEQDGRQYLVMEYVKGGSLRDLLHTEGRLPTSRAVPIMIELADALARAHHLRVLHRDLKPENVLLASDGTPRLTDFGLARSVDEHSTARHFVLGTLAYLSPEALCGDAVDERSDIWAFGVLAFEMLAGQHPFATERRAALVTNILQREPYDLEALCADAPVALIDLIYRMLEKDRGARIPGARQVAAELEAVGKSFEWPHAAHERAPRAPGSIQVNSQRTQPIHNLPHSSTAFIGRHQELIDLRQLALDPCTRLITVLGTGGVGKTRLALELAHQICRERESTFATFARDGVWLVPLATIEAPDRIVASLAQVLGLTPLQHDDLAAAVLDCLSTKQLLLVLDNFEHVLSAASFIRQVLERAPGVKVLTTSRERLNLESEAAFHLDGLTLPASDTDTGLLESGAVQLFIDRALRAQPGFSTEDPASLAALAYICHKLHGLPLAILLAAAWVDTMSLSDIKNELESSLDILDTSQHDLPPRQRSLRGSFDHSYNLLSSAEQSVFQQLSVFRAGFSREAAEAVGGATLKTLRALVRKSLLRRDLNGRYEVHELLRGYASEKLEQASGVDEALDRYCRYFGQFMTERARAVASSRPVPARAAIEFDLDNIFAALEHSLRPGRAALMEPILEHEFIYGHQFAPVTGERSLLRCVEALRARKRNPKEREVFARALAKHGLVVASVGKLADARGIFDELDALLAEGPYEERTFVIVNIWRGSLLTLWNDPTGRTLSEVLEVHEHVDTLLRSTNEHWWVAYNALILAEVQRENSNLPSAREWVEQAWIRVRRLGYRFGFARCHALEGSIALGVGDLNAAQCHLEAALALANESGSRLFVPIFHLKLGHIALLQCDYSKARRHTRRALTLLKSLHGSRVRAAREQLLKIEREARLREASIR